jgi:hypothetical protein
MVDRFVFDLRIMTVGEAANLTLREIDHWAYRLFLRLSGKKRAI